VVEVKPVYGVKRPVRTWNPILINFQHIWLLMQDAWRTRNWWDKLRLWFMPTGWRPADVAEKYPVQIVQDFEHFTKYDSNPSKALVLWSWVQLFFTLVFMFFLFNHFADIGFPGVLWYGLFLFVSIYSYTTLLDRSKYALPAEVVRTALGLTLLWWLGDWFGLDGLVTGGSAGVAVFFIASLSGVGYFTKTECRSGSVVTG
jgi:hypothetical protein